MRKVTTKSLIVLAIVIASITSCTSVNRTIREANTRVNLTKSDFTLSEQVSAEATSVTILGIDFERLFMKKTASLDAATSNGISLASIPVIGNAVSGRIANYSLYELLQKNPGNDVVFYPQQETKVVKPILGLGFITKITTTKTTARLGKFNK